MSSSQSSSTPEATQQRPPLTMLNWANLIFYIINFVFTYGIGTLGWLGNGDNGELSAKYQTIVTPKSTAFLIWAVIFLMQGVFAVVQMLPKFRNKPMVQEGVSYYYILTCITQAGWTFAFAYEVIWLSLIFMISIWSSLIALLYKQYYTESDNTFMEFWFLRFPFAIHAGWLTAASALNVNVVVVWQEAPADIQLAVGIISLAVLHAISVWVLMGIPRANYTIAGVLCWANGWIYSELQTPNDKIVNTFEPDIISGVSYAAIAVSFIILTQMILRVGYDLIYKRFFMGTTSEGHEEAHLITQDKNSDTDDSAHEQPASGVGGSTQKIVLGDEEV
jgi:benzodiazapine receptor